MQFQPKSCILDVIDLSWDNDLKEEKKSECRGYHCFLYWTGNGPGEKTTCNVGDEGVRILSEALKFNTTLTELYLRSDENYPKEWLGPWQTDVVGNKIGDKGAGLMSEALIANRVLRQLYMTGYDVFEGK